MHTIAAGWAWTCAALAKRGERGASFVEYAMLLGLVAVVCIAAVTVIGQTNAESLSSTASALP